VLLLLLLLLLLLPLTLVPRGAKGAVPGAAKAVPGAEGPAPAPLGVEAAARTVAPPAVEGGTGAEWAP